MFCKNCGYKLNEGASFCSECGQKVGDAVVVSEETIKESNNPTKATTSSGNGKGTAIASMVLGIISLLFGWILIPLPIIGLILGLVSKEKCGEKIAGIVLNIISLVGTIIIWILLTLLVSWTVNIIDEEVMNPKDGTTITENIRDYLSDKSKEDDVLEGEDKIYEGSDGAVNPFGDDFFNDFFNNFFGGYGYME